MFSKNVFCSRVLELRKTINLSQAQLGAQIGVSKQTINEIEKGRNTTTLERAALIADFFDVSIDYLVGRTDNPNVNK